MYSAYISTKIDSSVFQDYFELAKKNPLYIEFYKEYDFADEAPMLGKKELAPILESKFKLQQEKTGVYLFARAEVLKSLWFFRLIFRKIKTSVLHWQKN